MTTSPGRSGHAARSGHSQHSGQAARSEPGAGALRALVVVASNRAAAGVYPDRSGPLIAEALRDWGFEVEGPRVVGDGAPVGEALRDAVAQEYDVVLTSGGTGVSPTDRTPEETAPLLERQVPGIIEAIRHQGVSGGVPTAMLTRGMAGVARGTVIINLPGSTGGVRDGLAVLEPVLVHLVDQVRGGDHG